MYRYDAVLFDMDGTLLDTLDDLAHALNLTLEEHKYPTHQKDDIAGFLGNGAQELIRNALPPYEDDAAVSQVLATFKQHYGRHCDRLTHPYPGILPMLSALDEAGIKLAIISNKTDAQVKQLAKTYFGSLIHTAIGSSESLPLKPAPDMLLAAIRELQVDPERALYIGDSHTDFEAAQNAELETILVRWGYEDPQTLSLLLPRFFVNDPAELPMLILQEQEDAL